MIYRVLLVILLVAVFAVVYAVASHILRLREPKSYADEYLAAMRKPRVLPPDPPTEDDALD